MGIAAIGVHYRQFIAVGDQQTAAIGHPGCIVGQNVGYATGIAAEGGHNPQGLFGLGLQMTVNKQLGAVRRKRTDQRSANLRR